MSIKLSFSKKYTAQHSSNYYKKHRATFSRRLSNWRDQQLAKKALKIAGEPQLVLDLPCRAGCFWETLTANPNRVLMAADNSFDMLHVACTTQRPELVSQITTL